MVQAMNRNWILAALAAGLAFGQEPAPVAVPPAASPVAPAAQPSRPPLQATQVQSVYMLPMANHLDQYLANQLLKRGIYQVTMDPKKADAVFTDNIGKSLEVQLEQLYPPPPTPAPPENEAATDDERDAQKKAESEKLRAKQDADWMATRSTLGRGRGNVFLVDRFSRTVVWSIYHPAKNSSAGEVNKAAEKIAESLAKQIKGQ
jgi:hypothetical protein